MHGSRPSLVSKCGQCQWREIKGGREQERYRAYEMLILVLGKKSEKGKHETKVDERGN